MDNPLRVSEPLPDLAVAERAGKGRWQAKGRPKGGTRRRAKKSEPESATALGDRGESQSEKDGASLPRTGPGEETPGDQELSAACYGPDRAIALKQPPKGRLIDIAV